MNLKTFTVCCMVVSCALDMFTSLVLLELGYLEANPLYAVLGQTTFWVMYVAMNAGLLVLLLATSERWWWVYLILWILNIVHLICGVHNLTLLR